VFNTTPHTATGYTPHELLFGRKPNIPDLLQREPPETQYTYDKYVKELQSRSQSSYQTARVNLERQKERSKDYHDRNVNTPYLLLEISYYYMTKRLGKADQLNYHRHI
jgi:hypothetical protein